MISGHQMYKLISSVLLIVLLAACANKKDKEFEMEEYYLRSQFTYWEAQDAFKFKYNEKQNLLFLVANIQADGNPYHLVVADKNWSESNNCGHRSAANKKLMFNQWLLLDCNYDRELNATTPIQKPIEFMPTYSGKYLFEISLLNGKPDQLRVSQMKKALPDKDVL